MGGADDCAIRHSISVSSGLPYALDVRSFTFSKGSVYDQTGRSIGSKEGVFPDIGLAGTGTMMEANCFNLQQKIKASPSDYNCGTDGKCLKKPDKALPCPRCDSLDTKFCYYNNYNVNQPRHFCKGCQRYWTAGGTLRNVAVGAGRRKRKHSSFESESGTEASSIECHTQQECSTTRSSLNDCKSPSSFKDPSDSGFRPGGVCQKKLQLPLVDSSSFVSGTLFSEKMQGKFSSEPPRAERNSTFHHKSGPTCSLGDVRKQAKVFHEFMQLKSTTALSTRHKNSCDFLQHFHVSSSDSNFFNTLNNELKDEGGKLVLAVPSERQASNESGCASSLTTQAVSEDACTNGGKSDVFSEISKEGDNCDKGDNLTCEKPDLPYHLFCKVSGKVRAINGSSQRDCTDLATGLSKEQSLKGPPETDDFGAAGTMLPMPPFWALSGERPGLLWGAPWCPTASAVNAAKAALMLNAGALQKSQSPPLKDMVLSSKMLAQNEPGKPRMESTNPEIRVWVPKTLRFKDVDEAARTSIWSTLGIREKQGPLLLGRPEDASHFFCKEFGTAAFK